MSPQRSRGLALAGLLAPGTLLLAGFFLVPLGIMAVYSLLSPGLYGGVEWEFYPFNYGRVLGAPLGDVEEFDPVYAGIFVRSLRLALVTVAVCLVLAYPAAFWVSRLPGRRKPLVLFLVTLPFFASLIIRIYAWILVLKPTGVLTRAMEALGLGHLAPDLMFTEAAVVIGLCYVLLPFMFLPVYASVEKLDPALSQASADLGATPLQGFLRVTLPLTAPGILAGCLLVFIPALGNFIVPALLGGAKVMLVGNTIEQQFLAARNWPFGAALAMLVLATILLAMLGLALRPRGATGASRA